MKFEIVKNLDYTCSLVIKEDGATTGLPLELTDTARIMIASTGENSSKIIDWIDMTQSDAVNGKFSVTIPASSTNLLESKVGFAEDNYNTIGNYQAVFDTNTVAQGHKTYIIDDVYVKDVGL